MQAPHTASDTGTQAGTVTVTRASDSESLAGSELVGSCPAGAGEPCHSDGRREPHWQNERQGSESESLADIGHGRLAGGTGPGGRARILGNLPGTAYRGYRDSGYHRMNRDSVVTGTAARGLGAGRPGSG